MASEETNEIVCQEAALLANRYAQQEIDIIGKHGTEVFVSHANLEGEEFALALRFSYAHTPKIEALLYSIADRALSEALEKYEDLLIYDALASEIQI